MSTPSFLCVYPILPVTDLPAALEYYEDKLGFSVAWRWGDPLVRAGVRRDDVEIQLAIVPDDTLNAPAQVYCHVTGLAPYYEDCVRRGARIHVEMGARPWGMVDFRVLDPDGNQVGFGETAESAGAA